MDQKPTIRILKPGTFTSLEGKQITFGAKELQEIADSYDADSDPAPLVIGHPKLEDQAWGWVGSMSVEGGNLVAHADTIEATFAERVKRGDYRKISAQLYEPDNPHNPKPGQFYLKHVGFFGAHPVGVKGLGTVQFAEGDEDTTVTIESHTETIMTGKTTTPAKTPDPAAQEASFAEREAALADREAQIAEREADHQKAAAKERHEANVSFAEGLVNETKLAPAGKVLLVGVLDQLGELAADATVSFGEGETIRPDAALKKLLADATPLISLGEAAKPGKKTEAGLASFAAPAGYTVDPAQADLHAAATKIRAASPNRPWMDCVREAQAAQSA